MQQHRALCSTRDLQLQGDDGKSYKGDNFGSAIVPLHGLQHEQGAVESIM
jgi:hypothetical protein